jgi:hypothetical protein
MPSRYEVSRQIHIGCGLERMNLDSRFDGSVERYLYHLGIMESGPIPKPRHNILSTLDWWHLVYAAQLIVATVHRGVIKRLTPHLASHFDLSLDYRQSGQKSLRWIDPP